MFGFVVSAIIGIICIILGISNMRGNISSLHSYHRSRVKEEDVLPFGRLVGLGTIIIGVSIILFSGLSALDAALGNSVFTVIGAALLIAGISVGMGITFYGMKKYNGGIF